MSAHGHYGLTLAVRSVRPIRVRIVCATRRKPSAPLGIYPQVPLYGQIGSTLRHNTPNTTITIVLILILLLFAHSPHIRSFCGHTSHSHPSARRTDVCYHGMRDGWAPKLQHSERPADNLVKTAQTKKEEGRYTTITVMELAVASFMQVYLASVQANSSRTSPR
jgi:hypothetical protein